MIFHPSTAPAESDSGLHLRHDLIHRRLELGDQSMWVTKDPISGDFFYFSEREHTILNSIDGRDPIEIVREYAAKYSTDFLSADALVSFIAQVRRCGLLSGSEPSESVSDVANRSQRISGFLSPLAIRIPGINPDRMLSAVEPFVRPVFSTTTLVFVVGSFLFACMAIVLRADQFFLELSLTEAWATPSMMLAVVIVLSATKIIHELAHAITCRYFGGSCPEIGVMLLVFVPCLFCDVSDSWLQPSRWKRIAVAAAGMIAELLLASFAAILWCVTTPGPVHTLCITVVIVCSASTILFNGNPLMRYDGYFILSDLVGIPNLASESSTRLMQRIKQIFTGIEATENRGRSRASDVTLISYAILSLIYRVLIVAAILFAIHKFAAAWDFRIFAWLLTSLMLFRIASGVVKTFRQLGLTRVEKRSVRRGRVAVGLMVTGIFLAAALLLPMPCCLTVPYITDYQDQQKLYATTAGNVRFAAAAGHRVELGERVIELENRELQLEIQTLSSESENLKKRREHLRNRRTLDSDVASQLPAVEQLIELNQSKLELKQHEADGLVLAANQGGHVMAPRARESSSGKAEFGGWTGTPLDSNNINCFVERGTLLGSIRGPGCGASLLVSERHVEQIRVGQRVQLHYPGFDDIPARVKSVGVRALTTIEPEFSAKMLLPMESAAAGELRPMEPTFRVEIAIDGSDSLPIAARTTGWANIRVEPKSALDRLLRFLADSLRFKIGS